MESSGTALLNMVLSGGRYRILDKLGEGGMGSVYRARDQNLDADVVIKIPRRSSLDDAEFAQRFQREIRSLVQLAHPHIVKVFDAGIEDGLPYAVMQYLPGGSLESRRPIGPDGKHLPVLSSTLHHWLPTVAAALDFIHSQKYVHRDVKPANILFDGHQHAYLGDFGVAKALASREERQNSASLTGAGLVLGTPRYMAPELVMGRAFDGRADQYALAVVVFELLAGKPPIDGPTAAAILVQQTTVAPPRLDQLVRELPAEVVQAVDQALSKKPTERFPSCVAFAQALLAKIEQPSPVVQAVAENRCSTGPVGRVPCPACHKVLPLKEKYAGRRIRCPYCAVSLRVAETLDRLAELGAASGQIMPFAAQPQAELVYGWGGLEGKNTLAGSHSTTDTDPRTLFMEPEPLATPAGKFAVASGANRSILSRIRARKPAWLALVAASVFVLMVTLLGRALWFEPGPPASLAQPPPAHLASPVSPPERAAPEFQPLTPIAIDEEQPWQHRFVLETPTGEWTGPVEFIAPDKPAGWELDPHSGEAKWTPSEEQGPGDYTVRVLALDPQQRHPSGQTSIQIHVNEVNRPPEIEAPATPLVVPAGPWRSDATKYSIHVTDPDVPKNPIAITTTGEIPSGLHLDLERDNSATIIGWIPPNNWTTQEVELRLSASDGQHPSAESSVTVTLVLCQGEAVASTVENRGADSPSTSQERESNSSSMSLEEALQLLQAVTDNEHQAVQALQVVISSDATPDALSHVLESFLHNSTLWRIKDVNRILVALLAKRRVDASSVFSVKNLRTLLDNSRMWDKDDPVYALLYSLKENAAGVVPNLLQIIRSDAPTFTKVQACNALGALGPLARDSVPTLAECLAARDYYVQVAAVEALGAIGPPAADSGTQLASLLSTGSFANGARELAIVNALQNIRPTDSKTLSILAQIAQQHRSSAMRRRVDRLLSELAR